LTRLLYPAFPVLAFVVLAFDNARDILAQARIRAAHPSRITIDRLASRKARRAASLPPEGRLPAC
jgi:hypothetical protein